MNKLALIRQKMAERFETITKANGYHIDVRSVSLVRDLPERANSNQLSRVYILTPPKEQHEVREAGGGYLEVRAPMRVEVWSLADGKATYLQELCDQMVGDIIQAVYAPLAGTGDGFWDRVCHEDSRLATFDYDYTTHEKRCGVFMDWIVTFRFARTDT